MNEACAQSPAMPISARRRGVPVPHNQRPVRHRQASRVVIRAVGRVLLMHDCDPGVAGSGWLITPGGGLEPGEDWRSAAVRELAEETGLRVDDEDLIGPVAQQVVRHGYCDQILIQTERFFIVDVPAPFEPDTAGFTEGEKQSIKGFVWATREQLGSQQVAGQPVWPSWLVKLVDAKPGELVDYGQMDESTVAIEPGDVVNQEF